MKRAKPQWRAATFTSVLLAALATGCPWSPDTSPRHQEVPRATEAKQPGCSTILLYNLAIQSPTALERRIGTPACAALVAGPEGAELLSDVSINAPLQSVKLLLEIGISPTALLPDGRPSALHQVSRVGRPEALALLLKQGADLLAMDGDGLTALHGACDPSVIEQLLASGANPDGAPSLSDPPLVLAAQAGCESGVKALLEGGATIDGRRQGGDTALIKALAQGHDSIVRLLLTRGADASLQSETGVTSLHVVGEASLVPALIKAGAPIEAHSTSVEVGGTPLLVAAAGGQREVLAALLKAGANSNAIDEGGMTALHWAAQENSSMVKELLKAGAKPSVIAKGGETPLHLAVLGQKLAIVSLLVEAGADRTIKNADGLNAIDLAQGLEAQSSDLELIRQTLEIKAFP